MSNSAAASASDELPPPPLDVSSSTGLPPYVPVDGDREVVSLSSLASAGKAVPGTKLELQYLASSVSASVAASRAPSGSQPTPIVGRRAPVGFSLKPAAKLKPSAKLLPAATDTPLASVATAEVAAAPTAAAPTAAEAPAPAAAAAAAAAAEAAAESAAAAAVAVAMSPLAVPGLSLERLVLGTLKHSWKGSSRASRTLRPHRHPNRYPRPALAHA